MGGAERVLCALHEIWPEAPIYTSIYNRKKASWADDFEIHTSWLQKLPFGNKLSHEKIPFLMPIVFESFDFKDFDVVISITSAEAKGIITSPGTKHICYCLTPTRYLWSGYEEYFPKQWQKKLYGPIIRYMKWWDKAAASRPDYYVSISQTVAERVKQFYQRESEVIYPPVDNIKNQKSICQLADKNSNKKLKIANFFLIVSRLVPYKKVDLAIKAFNELKLPLAIVGRGSEEEKLKSIAGKNIYFTGQLTDSELVWYYEHCNAFVMPQEEDFGITAVEAQLFGKPVIAYAKGGATETVIDGVTGMLFYKQTVNDLIQTVSNFQSNSKTQMDIIKHVEKFSKERFKKEFKSYIERITI